MRIPRSVLALEIAALAMIGSGCARRIALQDAVWRQLVDSHREEAEIDGLRMHYVDLGSGEPVVMIHGIGDSTYSWRENAPALVEAGFRVVLVDQPGFGLSAIPAEGWTYSVENQAEAVLRVVDCLGIGRFQLVGHSLGGGESLYLAWKHPERVGRVAVLSPASQRTSCPFGLGSDLVARASGTRWFTARALQSAYYRPERVSDVMIDEYARLLDRPGRMGTGVLGGVCRDYFSPAYDQMTRSYGELEPPLLIVWGEQDTWHPIEFGTKLRAAVPASRLEIVPEAGHNVQQERSDLVNPLLIRFLRGGGRG
jgi:4,5:9,10-diseco-3-hydroxy-5,9,17-trioxoandrosta-1(10),2-diene-4-oate hydrolase